MKFEFISGINLLLEFFLSLLSFTLPLLLFIKTLWWLPFLVNINHVILFWNACQFKSLNFAHTVVKLSCFMKLLNSDCPFSFSLKFFKHFSGAATSFFDINFWFFCWWWSLNFDFLLNFKHIILWEEMCMIVSLWAYSVWAFNFTTKQLLMVGVKTTKLWYTSLAPFCHAYSIILAIIIWTLIFVLLINCL